MNRSILGVILFATFALCACGGGSTGAVCDKLIECAGAGDKSACVDLLNDYKDDMRTVAWNAYSDCLLDLSCEDLLGSGFADCLMQAAEAVPEGVSDGVLEAYCQQMIDCGYMAIPVAECVEQSKAVAGSNANLIGIYNDQVLGCMQDCTGDLDCSEINRMWEICMQQCGLIPEVEPYCDHGYEQGDECICDQGWAGEYCDSCAPGYVMDQWGDCQPSCQADTCSGHGVCDDSYGQITCSCDPGYLGDRCQDCAPGYVRVGDDCLPTAGCQVDGTPCDDGQWCTEGDVCSGGVCVGSQRDCDDGLACTADSCIERHEVCMHEPTPSGEPEGFLGDPTCENGLDDDCDGYTDAGDDDCWLDPCDTPADCVDDGNSCTEARCDAGYCEHVPLPDYSACPGSDSCTTRFVCKQAICIPGPSDQDADGDGSIDAACPGGWDCDDGDPAIGPGAEGPRGDASCQDSSDNDCDGLTDVWDPDCWEPQCSPEGWCWESPLPQGKYLAGLWAADSNNAWAVGGDGTILYWDGTGWTRQPCPVSDDLVAVSGCGPDDVWAAGGWGDLVHYDGFDWFDVSPGEFIDINDVHCVAGTDPTQVWLAGGSDAVRHWTGTAWESHTPGTGMNLHAVWAVAADDVWVAGRDGALAHLESGAWTVVDLGTGWDLNVLWGQAGTMFVAGDQGECYLDEGSGWVQDATGTGSEFRGLWGVSPDDLWGVTDWWGSIQHRGPSGWTAVSMEIETPSMYDVWGSASNDVWAVGEGGNIFHYDGATWTGPGPTSEPLYAVCAMEDTDGSIDAWALGDVVMRYDGTQWRLQATHGYRMRAMYCRNPEDIWAASENGLHHWDGIEWDHFEDLTTSGLSGISGLSAGPDVWAVGGNGVVLYYDGSSWAEEDVGVNDGFLDVWANDNAGDPQAWVVGGNGTIMFWDQRGWTQMNSQTSETLYGVWGDGDGQVWAVGTNATVLHFTQGWNVIDDPVLYSDFSDVWGTPSGEIWIAGWYQFAHFDGMNWTQDSLPNHSFESITATPSGHVWMAGGWGGILHRWP